ncbi:MAG: RadC family protein [Dethiobacteria bacterium]|jgi:DNA repair protein RadC|nr:DNA repair protein RadC [Bacillota bacterium]
MAAKNLTIKELPQQERPRERLQQLGAEALSNVELLAVLLRTGTKELSAMRLAEQLLSRVKSLRALPEITLEELQEIKGIGLAKAVQIKAALELGKRLATSLQEDRPQINSPADAASLFMEELRYKKKEYFKILLLDTKNRVLTREQVSEGSLNASIVDIRHIFGTALKKSAASLILVHNHPSGDPHPSREDIRITKRIKEVGELMGIELLDHLIIGDGCFLSFKEKDLL